MTACQVFRQLLHAFALPEALSGRLFYWAVMKRNSTIWYAIVSFNCLISKAGMRMKFDSDYSVFKFGCEPTFFACPKEARAFTIQTVLFRETVGALACNWIKCLISLLLIFGKHRVEKRNSSCGCCVDAGNALEDKYWFIKSSGVTVIFREAFVYTSVQDKWSCR